MVKIVDYKERESADGSPFYALILQGGVEIVESANGRMYATARKTSMVSSFDEATCKMLIGQDIPGSIEKVEVEPYEYTHPVSGEVIFLTHRYEYVHEQAKETVDFTVADMQTA